MFFAAHIDGSSGSNDTYKTSMMCLPSIIRTQNFCNLRYQRVLKFGPEVEGLRRLQSAGNIKRKVMMLPTFNNVHIGLAQRCCSVLKMESEKYGWTGILLLDPPINAMQRSSEQVALHSDLLQGEYEEFLKPGSFFQEQAIAPGRLSHFKDLVYYWTRKLPPSFDKSDPSLLLLSYYPLRIVAAEWTKYMELLNRTVRQYEYSSAKDPAENQRLGIIGDDLRSMLVWTRRCTQCLRKLRYAVLFIQLRSLGTVNNDYNLLGDDYKHLAGMVEAYRGSLDTKMQVVTSMVQIIDSQRSQKQARNITRLTNLALLLILMSFTTGLLGMNDHISTQALVLFFGLAVSACVAVFVVARVPRMKTSQLAEKDGRWRSGEWFEN
ncbi:hypothetical protein BJ875DRAFT_445102 [Amylocarpus encephaloides]|uniref:Uncharacterized protein n=1 Tax=Amylocarpus encephaloides TaxID=45428 RepID=A0A9P7YC93_9HELO|nr:hypothetical protein BJ875DRAFT_445102 [Amylocarpus encephaloides]